MRNSKVKGFTLIELIVVIAIIAILATILVPSLLGYIRTSRISTANANARVVNTSVSTALTQAYTNGKKIGTGANEISGNITVASGKIEVAFPTGGTGGSTIELVDYLGVNFKGSAIVCYNATTYSINYALWHETQGAAPAPTSATGGGGTTLGYKDSDEQVADARNNNKIIGCDPFPPVVGGGGT